MTTRLELVITCAKKVMSIEIGAQYNITRHFPKCYKYILEEIYGQSLQIKFAVGNKGMNSYFCRNSNVAARSEG
jgi:hypothetical protein